MDYKLKYFFLIVFIAIAFFVFAVVILSIIEIISTKSLQVTYNLGGRPAIVAVGGVIVYSFLMSFIYIPTQAKPTVISITIEKEIDKVSMLCNIENLIMTYKESNAKRTLKTEQGGKIVYTTGKKYLDMFLQPIEVSFGEDNITVSAPLVYTEEIKKIINDM